MASVERQRRLLSHLQPAPASAVVEADVEAAAQALIGLPVEALDTPSLYVDLDAVESNIGVMSEQIRSTGAVWRPHTKAIRSPALAQMLVDGGAVGVTCAKITQAAALVAAGIKDVLIANEIVGPIKVANLVELSKSCDRLTVAVDNADNLRAISAEAVTQDAQMSVLVDLNIGMNRCGIHWSKQDEIVMMSQLATDLPNIEFMGLMCALRIRRPGRLLIASTNVTVCAFPQGLRRPRAGQHGPARLDDERLLGAARRRQGLGRGRRHRGAPALRSRQRQLLGSDQGLDQRDPSGGEQHHSTPGWTTRASLMPGLDAGRRAVLHAVQGLARR